MSVWVEIKKEYKCYEKCRKSRSTWACELKCERGRFICLILNVTLHVSVWVEIWALHCQRKQPHWSRSTWACELKFIWYATYLNNIASRSTWACELKWNLVLNYSPVQRSRSTWACELKWIESSYAKGERGHAPRERVSWNVLSISIMSPLSRHKWKKLSWQRKLCIAIQKT